MNLFSALTEGRGRLTETNLSAFLAFLLSPNRAHGLADTFLRSFLGAVADACGEPERFASVLRSKQVSADVGLEVRHAFGNISRTVDIEIELYDPDIAGGAERHRLIIENKIRPGAAQEAQFKEEFQCVHAEVDTGTAITAVLLTPAGNSTGLVSEYEQLVPPTAGFHRKAWLRWDNHKLDHSGPSVVDLIRDLLRREAGAEIEPVSEYTRHTLKAFVQFVGSVTLPTAPGKVAGDLEDDKIVEQHQVVVAGRAYQLVRLGSGTVKAYDADTGQEVSAKPLLRRVNDELQLRVELRNAQGNLRNTRQLGKLIMDQLRNQIG